MVHGDLESFVVSWSLRLIDSLHRQVRVLALHDVGSPAGLASGGVICVWERPVVLIYLRGRPAVAADPTFECGRFGNLDHLESGWTSFSVIARRRTAVVDSGDHVAVVRDPCPRLWRRLGHILGNGLRHHCRFRQGCPVVIGVLH